MALPTTPIKTTSTRNKGLLMAYQPPLSLNKALFKPVFLVGVVLMGVVGRAMK